MGNPRSSRSKRIEAWRGIILDSPVERARVSRWRRVWVGATTLQAHACKAEQRPRARCQWFNRVCSAVTQEVNAIEAEIVSIHAGLVGTASGQLRNLGSFFTVPELDSGIVNYQNAQSTLRPHRWPPPVQRWHLHLSNESAGVNRLFDAVHFSIMRQKKCPPRDNPGGHFGLARFSAGRSAAHHA